MATSPVPADPPLSLEPVLGWRIWRLHRADGILTLRSVTRSDTWPSNRAMQAKCATHRGATIPNRVCTCGLYAAATPEYLARSGMLNPHTCVVGAIAMWGTVVEHERGARSRFAYPARLRLVCGPCLTAGAGAVDPQSVVDTAGVLTTVCARHGKGITGPTWPADQVQSELLSTYGVDVMPIERVDRSLRFPSGQTAPNAATLRNAGRVALSLVRAVGLGLFWLWAMSGFLVVGAGLLGAVVTHFIHHSPPAAAATMPPVTGTRLAVRPKNDLSYRGTLPPPPPETAFLCGVGNGGTVSIVPCSGDPEQLLGFAALTAPRGPKRDCVPGWDAYSRGNNYWICWADFWGPLSVHPWASAPNPWSIPHDEGGAFHEHR